MDTLQFNFINYEFNELLTSVFYALIRGTIANKSILIETTQKLINSNSMTHEQQQALLSIFNVDAEPNKTEHEFLKIMYRPYTKQSIVKLINDAFKSQYISKYDYLFLMLVASIYIHVDAREELEKQKLNIDALCNELHTKQSEFIKAIKNLD